MDVGRTASCASCLDWARGLIHWWFFRQVHVAILRLDILPHLIRGNFRDIGQIGPHVGDQTRGSHSVQLNALIQLLCNRHGFTSRESQFARGILL